MEAIFASKIEDVKPRVLITAIECNKPLAQHPTRLLLSSLTWVVRTSGSDSITVDVGSGDGVSVDGVSLVSGGGVGIVIGGTSIPSVANNTDRR